MKLEHVYLGKLIKTLRLDAGVTQSELALAIGYDSPQFVSNCERGLCGIPHDKIIDMCKVIGIKSTEYCSIASDLYYVDMMKDLGLGTEAKLKKMASEIVGIK